MIYQIYEGFFGPNKTQTPKPMLSNEKLLKQLKFGDILCIDNSKKGFDALNFRGEGNCFGVYVLSPNDTHDNTYRFAAIDPDADINAPFLMTYERRMFTVKYLYGSFMAEGDDEVWEQTKNEHPELKPGDDAFADAYMDNLYDSFAYQYPGYDQWMKESNGIKDMNGIINTVNLQQIPDYTEAPFEAAGHRNFTGQSWPYNAQYPMWYIPAINELVISAEHIPDYFGIFPIMSSTPGAEDDEIYAYNFGGSISSFNGNWKMWMVPFISFSEDEMIEIMAN